MESWLTRMKQRLGALNMTQDALAQKLRISRSSVCHYLSSRRLPSFKRIVKIAEALECDPAWLQDGVTNTVASSKTEPVKRAKEGGGKLNRCMIIQARLDPELHQIAQMLARQQRQTLSSLIEMLVKNEVQRLKIIV